MYLFYFFFFINRLNVFTESLFLFLCLKLSKFFIGDKFELCFLFKEHVLICLLLVKLSLVQNVLTDFFGGFGQSDILLSFSLCQSVLFFLSLSLLNDEKAFFDFLFPELFNVLLFVRLDVFNIWRDFIQE